MAVTFTVTPVKTYVLGDRKEVLADVTCTGTPTAGGDILTGQSLGLDLETNLVQPVAPALDGTAANGIAVAVDHAGAAVFNFVKIVFLAQGTAGAANAQVAFTGATAGFKFRVRAVGKGKAS